MTPDQGWPSTDLRVLVAGGSTGTGLATAHALCAAGASVSLCGRDAERVTAAVRELREAYTVDAIGSALDLNDADARAAWISAAADRWGGMDAFVANAGANLGAGQWVANLGANLEWVVGACDEVHPYLTRSRGAIVVLSSISVGLRGLGLEHLSYASSKAALERFAIGLARAWGGDGIRVNVVSPGPIVGTGGYWDDMTDAHPGIVAELAGRAALGRLVSADEVASAVAFLAGPFSRGTTGATLVVDAGLSLGTVG